MNLPKTIFITLTSSLALFSIILMTNCLPQEEEADKVIRYYSGSDPKGDFLEVVINETDSIVTEVNHTTGDTNGPFPFVQATGTDAMGFNIIYKAAVNQGSVSYVLFAEYPNAAVIFQLFDNSDNPIGNPQYAIIRQQLNNSDMYEKAFNWMQFTIDDSDASSDMECGFAAWDASSNNGSLFGAGYSNRAEVEGWSTNGINNINETGTVNVDGFGTDTTTISRYFYSQPGHDGDWDYRITLTGTPSGACILDFGINAGGGSGLALPQATNSVWSSTYNGTYFMMVYEWNGATNSINPMKCVFSGTTTGHIKVYSLNPETLVAEGDLKAVADLTAGESPGGVAVTTQFATVSGLGTAVSTSTVITQANQCKGSFVLMQSGGGSTEITFIMINPDGKFGGFTGFSDDGATKTYRFGFCLKDSSL